MDPDSPVRISCRDRHVKTCLQRIVVREVELRDAHSIDRVVREFWAECEVEDSDCDSD